MSRAQFKRLIRSVRLNFMARKAPARTIPGLEGGYRAWSPLSTLFNQIRDIRTQP
jgi:hypothetical protein